MTVPVRRAALGDRESVVLTITEAFDGDPAWAFMLGSAYSHAAPLFAGALFDSRVGAGWVWTTDDHSAVALWRGPEPAPGAPDATELWQRLRRDVGEDVWARIAAYDTAVEAVAPEPPYWYLGVLAVRPRSQGRGLARIVLEPGLAVADSERLPVWLETSVRGNTDIYARFGFAVVEEVDVPGGPATWWLTRPAGVSGA